LPDAIPTVSLGHSASRWQLFARPSPLRFRIGALNVWLRHYQLDAYLKTLTQPKEAAVLTLASLKQGIYQVLDSGTAPRDPEYSRPVLALRETYRPGTFLPGAHQSN